jgi:hypothetical protein
MRKLRLHLKLLWEQKIPWIMWDGIYKDVEIDITEERAIELLLDADSTFITEDFLERDDPNDWDENDSTFLDAFESTDNLPEGIPSCEMLGKPTNIVFQYCEWIDEGGE